MQNSINFKNNKMEDLDLKMNYIVGKIGKLKFAEKLDITFVTLAKYEKNNDLFTIKILKKIDEIYNELRKN